MPRPQSLDTLGQRLLAARKHKGMNQTQVAEAAGIEQPAVSKIELGKITETAAIGRLATAVDVPVLWLESGEGPPPKWLGGEAGSESEPAPSRYTSETTTYKAVISFDSANPEAPLLMRLLSAAGAPGIVVEVEEWTGKSTKGKRKTLGVGEGVHVPYTMSRAKADPNKKGKAK